MWIVILHDLDVRFISFHGLCGCFLGLHMLPCVMFVVVWFLSNTNDTK